jgi:hypothetical protein
MFLLKIPKIVLYGIYNSSHLIIGKYSNNSNNGTKGCTWALGAPSGRGPLATSRPSPCIVHTRHNNKSQKLRLCSFFGIINIVKIKVLEVNEV